jgi:O-antigen/teichoic acid export membrane protein
MRYAAVTRVSKNAAVLLLGTVARMLLTFAFVIYIARYLGVNGYGKYALATQLFELFLSLIATGFGILVTRESAKNIEWLSRHLATLVAMIVTLSVLGAGILAIVARLAGYAPDTQMAIYIACAALIPAALCSVAESAFIAFEKAEFVASGVALESLVRIGLCFVALWMGYGLLSMFVILVATRWLQLFVYAILLWRRLPNAEFRVEPVHMWALALEWRVFAAETWIANLYVSLDVVLLSLFHGETAVGLYDAAWKLIRFGPVIASSFTMAIFPYISRLYVDAKETFQLVSEQSVKYILAGILPAVLGISIFADRIVLLLFTEQYAGSAGVLRVLAWMLVPQFLNPFLSRVLYARGQQKRSLAVAIVGLITFSSMAFILIPAYGSVGAAWTIVFSAYAALIAYFWHSMLGTDRRPLFIIFVRQAVAAAALLLVLLFMRDSQSLPMLVACPVLYAGLLVGLGIVSLKDVQLLQELR